MTRSDRIDIVTGLGIIVLGWAWSCFHFGLAEGTAWTAKHLLFAAALATGYILLTFVGSAVIGAYEGVRDAVREWRRQS